MTEQYPLPLPRTYLYQLTLRRKGEKSNVYSTGISVDDAFRRYLDRLTRRHETDINIELVQGEFANPNLSTHQ
jgi:hypothetical protein